MELSDYHAVVTSNFREGRLSLPIFLGWRVGLFTLAIMQLRSRSDTSGEGARRAPDFGRKSIDGCCAPDVSWVPADPFSA